MFRHYIIAALRNLAANRLQSAIAVFGLAVGLSAAIMAGLVVWNQFTYDSFLPLHERLYMLGMDAVTGGGQTAIHIPFSYHGEAAKLANVPDVEAVARMSMDFGDHLLRGGAVQGEDAVMNVDPNIFDLLRLTTLHGDLKTALDRPDAIVIPLSAARKYFGADNVVGQILIMDKVHPLRVTAVVADLPINGTNLNSAFFVSSRAAWSPLAKADAAPPAGSEVDCFTYVRLRPDASVAAVTASMREISKFLLPLPPVMHAQPRLIPIAALHVDPDYSPGVVDQLKALLAVAVTILFLSSINFVNLVTAKAARRSVEVGVRKAVGAGRGDLVFQFLGEAVVQALIALILALAIVELSLPTVDAALQTGASLTYGGFGWVAAALVGGALVVGVLAGFYPALLLSAFRPFLVLKGGPLGTGRTPIRQGLVIIQFAVLAVLGIGAGVLLMQYRFAINRTVEHADRVLLVGVPKCEGKFLDSVAALPGVDATACTDISFIKAINGKLTVKFPDGGTLALDFVTAGPGLVKMFGQQPIAGRDLVSSDRINGGNSELIAGNAPFHILINQTALHGLGIVTPQAAIGHAMRLEETAAPAVIVGVVRDFSAYALEQPIGPTAYLYLSDVPSLSPFLAVKLSGSLNAVRMAVGRDWDQTVNDSPFDSILLSEWIARQRQPLLAQGAAAGVFAGIAMLLGCLGLFGLSVSAAERRTKEIGIRKSMGACRSDILGLLVWQFAKPVLWANLIAWPVAFWAMNRWLNGFAYHVAMPLWLFPVVGATTLLVALLTVAGQALLVTRQRPVLALRYE